MSEKRLWCILLSNVFKVLCLLPSYYMKKQCAQKHWYHSIKYLSKYRLTQNFCFRFQVSSMGLVHVRKVVSSTKVVLVVTSEWNFCSECFESLLSVHYLAINTWSWSPSYGQNNFRAWEWRNKWVIGSGDASSECVCCTKKSAEADDPRI